MTYTFVRPRALTWLAVALLVAQAAMLVNALTLVMQSPGRPNTVLVVNAVNGVLLATGLLVAPKYPRVTWALLVLSVACIVLTAIVFRRR